MDSQKLLKKKQKAIEEKNETALCSACTDLANFYISEENFHEAIREFEILGKIYKKQKKMLDFATVNRGIGEAYMFLTNYEKAIEYQKIYLGLSKQQENKLEEQRALATLGHTYLTKYIVDKQNKNDLIVAHKYTMKSLEVCESLTDIKKFDMVDMTARLYNNLGVIHEYQGNHDKSKELFNKAIILCKANDVYESLHQAYNSLASLLERRGEYNSAIQNYNMAIETAKKLKDKVSALHDCLVSKATILLKLGDLQAAKKSLHKAYKLKLPTKTREDVEKKLKTVVRLYRKEKEMISKSYSGIELQKFYEKMGDGFSALNCFDKALHYYHKMLEIAKSTETNLSLCYYSIAATYRDDEQYDKAIEYFEKEYALCDFKKGLDTLCEIADTKESGGRPSSDIIEVYERAIQKCKAANNQREEGRMLGRLVNYLERSGESKKLHEYKRRFDESGFESSDSEEPTQESNSGEDISLDNLTDESEGSESESPSRKRRPKTFQVRRNLRGETQLHTACISGKTNVVRHLLDQGHPVNIRDNGGWLPLHDACISGHYDVVELLLDKGASVNDRGGTHCNGTTPLHDAAVNGHLAIMELLLNRGASALAKTDEGETPYHYLKKASMELQFDDEQKVICERLLERMSVILDKAGQSKEINTSIKNKAFVNGQRDQLEQSFRRRSAPEFVEDRDVPQKRRSSNYRKSIDKTSSDDDIDQFTLSRRSAPKTQATNEYKRVMDNLRNKSYDSAFDNTETTSSKRSAYVMDEENVGDDWLEDDLKDVRTSKKRKMGFAEGLINSSKMRSSQPLKRYNSFETVSSKSSKSSHKSMTKSPGISKNLSSNENDTVGMVAEDANNLNVVEQLAFVPVYINDDSDCDFVEPKNLRRKQQSSLLDAGFARCTQSSDKSKRNGSFSKKRSLQPKITHFGSTTPTKMSQSSHRLSPSPRKWSHTSPNKSSLIDEDPMLAMDVNIEGRPFRVTTRMSMKEQLTVKWLALEAARRYAKKEYVEPVLELTTQSGAELVDDDTIGTLFITDCQVVEVNAKVLKWNLPPVQERYKEACSDMSTKPLDSVCLKLEALTISLEMGNAGLHPASVAPLCKSLLRETRLLELDLSNNFLTLDCVKLLAASLLTLENLTKLNLSSTNLHAEEIRYLSNMFSNSPVDILTKLCYLNLSQNFIGDESLQDVASITRHLKLKELDLALLNFTEDVFKKSYNRNATFDLSNLEHFNLSGNNLGNTALLEILSFLDGNRLSHLDVSDNRASEGFLTSLIDCLNKRAARFSFDYLNLARCSVVDTEVFSLLRYCDNLKTLNISYTNVTSLTLRRILESNFIKNITIFGCQNINKYLEDVDDLWNLSDYRYEQKTLKITCDKDKFHILIKLWNTKYCDKVSIDKMENLLILK